MYEAGFAICIDCCPRCHCLRWRAIRPVDDGWADGHRHPVSHGLAACNSGIHAYPDARACLDSGTGAYNLYATDLDATDPDATGSNSDHRGYGSPITGADGHSPADVHGDTNPNSDCAHVSGHFNPDANASADVNARPHCDLYSHANSHSHSNSRADAYVNSYGDSESYADGAFVGGGVFTTVGAGCLEPSGAV